MEAKVHRAKDGKLRVNAHPRHGDGEQLLPLVGKAGGQPFMVRYIIRMKDSLCGTHNWCEGGLEFLSSGTILGPLGGRSTVGYGFL